MVSFIFLFFLIVLSCFPATVVSFMVQSTFLVTHAKTDDKWLGWTHSTQSVNGLLYFLGVIHPFCHPTHPSSHAPHSPRLVLQPRRQQHVWLSGPVGRDTGGVIVWFSHCRPQESVLWELKGKNCEVPGLRIGPASRPAAHSNNYTELSPVSTLLLWTGGVHAMNCCLVFSTWERTLVVSVFGMFQFAGSEFDRQRCRPIGHQLGPLSDSQFLAHPDWNGFKPP